MSSEPTERDSRRRLGVGAIVVLVIAALAVTVGIGILRGATAPVDAVSIEDPAPAVSAGPAGGLYVHVSGAVRAPGLYVLPDGARVVDAVAAAGGLADDAEPSAVNLARPLGDGEQLVVPVQGAAPDPQGGAAAAVAGDGRVNLNTASLAELDTLPRIGAAMAQRIIDWRDENGRFTSVDDLLAVPGIGDKMLESLRDLVSV